MRSRREHHRLLLLFLIVPGSLIGQESRSPQPQMTFTSSDGAFRFHYSAPILLCSRENGSDSWMPARSCSGYIPVCTDASGESAGTVACAAYHADEMAGTNFQSAAFAVNKLKKATQSECLAEEPDAVGKARQETIHGVKFQVTEVEGAATGHLISGYAYRSFHHGKCYEIDIKIASTNIGNYDPGSIKAFDSAKVERALKAVLASFRFLR